MNKFMRRNTKKEEGFTLIEILVVIGIIAVLAAIVLVAINPARQFAQARDTQRTSNVNAILNAVGQNMADNAGLFFCEGAEFDLPATVEEIDSTNADADIAPCLVPTYMPALPSDPTIPDDDGWVDVDDYSTGYTIQIVDARVQVCTTELEDETLGRDEQICVTR